MKATKRDTQFGRDLIQGLKEAQAYQKGEIALPTREIEPFTKERVREIRKKVATNIGEFSAKFGIPARTIEGWEQGRKIDTAARVLLTVLEKDPDAVERALTKAA